MSELAIYYRSSGKQGNLYYANGLAPNAMHTIATLARSGVTAEAVSANAAKDIDQHLANNDVRHAVIEAVWLSAIDLASLARKFPKTTFTVRAHSKMGFLQVEPEAVTILRNVMQISESLPNVLFASNNEEFAFALTEVYEGTCHFLPNLYDLESSPPREKQHGQPFRVCSFGATRLLKMHPSAALAALQVATRLGREMDFHINTDNTPGGDSVRRTMRNIFSGVSGCRLIEVPWQDAQTFRETIATMDLSIVLSATETFCLVAADSVASGVPLIASPSVSWLPETHPDTDDTSSVATFAIDALNDKKFAKRQEYALKNFIASAEKTWLEFLS